MKAPARLMATLLACIDLAFEAFEHIEDMPETCSCSCLGRKYGALAATA